MCRNCTNDITEKLEALANGEEVESEVPEGMQLAGMQIAPLPGGQLMVIIDRGDFATIMAAAAASGSVILGPILANDE